MTEQSLIGSKFQIDIWSINPRIFVLRNFLSGPECDHMIEIARAKIQRSTTVDPETGNLIEVDGRTSSSTYFWIRHDEIITEIEERIANLVNIPVENGEGLQVLNYRVGQFYNPHFDFFDPQHKGSAVPMATGGQRVGTCIMYLSTVEEGGETHFPEVGIKVPPVRGDAVFFYNVRVDGEVDRNTLHASLPVIRGEKWACTKWIREREYK
jgi:prolyl 4-hydroxylase